MSSTRRLTRQLCALLTPLTLAAALLVAYAPVQVGASSHREAPLISTDPEADATDFYMWVAPDANDKVTFVASYYPGQLPDGGPNYYRFGDDVLYEINIDNVGDGKAHIKYQFDFKTTYLNTKTFLYNSGPITPAMVNNTDPTWSLRQTYTITEVSDLSGTVVTKTLASNLPTPPSNIGEKSTPDYDALEAAAIKSFSDSGDSFKVYAGQTDDAFWVDLQVFDLLTLRGQAPPIGYSNGPTFGLDSLSGLNVQSIVLQVPISRLTRPNEPVIGGWTTSSRPSLKTHVGVAGILGGGRAIETDGPFVQVSRLGMPLTNEVVIPLALKDAFNNLKPEQDLSIYFTDFDPGPGSLTLQGLVENPELGQLLCGLYDVPMPGDSNGDCQTEFTPNQPATGRGDIFDIFLKGIKTAAPFEITVGGQKVTVPAGTNVNQFTQGTDGSGAGIQPAEMLRLNTAAPFRPGTQGSFCSATPSRLGVLGGDVCGFPNGRRPADDVVEIELLAVAGAAYPVLTNKSFTFNPALIGVLTDSVDYNDVPFDDAFPYVAQAHPGQAYVHTYARGTYLPIVVQGGGSRAGLR